MRESTINYSMSVACVHYEVGGQSQAIQSEERSEGCPEKVSIPAAGVGYRATHDPTPGIGSL